MGWLLDYVGWHTANNPIFTNPLAREAYLYAVGFACNCVRGMERDWRRVIRFEQILNEEYHRKLAILLSEETVEE